LGPGEQLRGNIRGNLLQSFGHTEDSSVWSKPGKDMVAHALARSASAFHCVPMHLSSSTTAIAVSLAFAAGVLSASLGRVNADPQPALDRGLVERLIRAQEAQVRAIEGLTRVAERCKP
jgi:hypothetical protein